MEEKPLLTIKEAAALLGVSRSLINKRIRQGKLNPKPLNPAYDKHGPVGIPRAEVEALLRRE